MCLSHNQQSCFGPVQAALGQIQLPAQAGNLGLLRGGTPNPGAGRLTSQDAGVMQPSSLGDLGGVQALLEQVGPTTGLRNGRLISGQVVKLLRGCERPTMCWATGAWL